MFSGLEGKQVPVAETVRGFTEILDGKHDAAAEGDFYMKGGLTKLNRVEIASVNSVLARSLAQLHVKRRQRN